jgi:type II secretory pathway component GspD/PulD (secretin)
MTPKLEEDTEPPEVYRPQQRGADYLRALLASVGLSNSVGFGAGNQAQAGQASSDVVLLTGDAKRRERARRLLAQIDSRPASISVRAALVEFTDTQERNLSIGAVLDLASSKITGNFGTASVGANGVQVKVSGISVALNALHGDTRFRYRSEAELRFVDGKPGRLQIGSDQPTRGDTTLTQTGVTMQGTVYRSSGIVLSVTPRIYEGRIEADVVQEVSSFASTTTSNIDSPTLNKRLVQATVDSVGGEIVVIGGLDEETVSDGSKGPFSWLQTTQAKTASKTQLFLLLEFKRLTPA